METIKAEVGPRDEEPPVPSGSDMTVTVTVTTETEGEGSDSTHVNVNVNAVEGEGETKATTPDPEEAVLPEKKIVQELRTGAPPPVVDRAYQACPDADLVSPFDEEKDTLKKTLTMLEKRLDFLTQILHPESQLLANFRDKDSNCQLGSNK